MPINLREINSNVTPAMQNIEHDGSLLIHGNVESGSFVVATHDIEVRGEINNSKIKSIKGNIKVHGGIKGVSSLLYAGGGNIEAKFVHNATLKAEQSVMVNDVVIDSQIIAKKSIFIEKGDGAIEGGEIEAGMDIVANIIGNPRQTVTIVKISDFKQRELFSQLLKFEKELEGIQKQMEQLEKFIEVIKILGNKVVTLPLEKKQELAGKVQKYNELKNKSTEIQSQQKLIHQENREEDELERTIIVREHIYEGVQVFIDKAKLAIPGHYSNVILYKRGIIIVGDYDQFMHRKKYVY